jgi:hypothetical protein
MSSRPRLVVAMYGFFAQLDVAIEYGLRKRRCLVERVRSIAELEGFCQSVACDAIALAGGVPLDEVEGALRGLPRPPRLYVFAREMTPESFITSILTAENALK